MNLQLPEINFAVQPVAGSRQAVKVFATPALIIVSDVVVDSDNAVEQAKAKLTTQVHSALYYQIYHELNTALNTIKSDPTAGLKQLATLHFNLKKHL